MSAFPALYKHQSEMSAIPAFCKHQSEVSAIPALCKHQSEVNAIPALCKHQSEVSAIPAGCTSAMYLLFHQTLQLKCLYVEHRFQQRSLNPKTDKPFQ